MNSTKIILESMGFKVELWEMTFSKQDSFQITDSKAVTFYMPENATVQQCMDRYREKLEQFKTTKG